MEFYRFEVRGRVQGVGFRQTLRAKARALELCGWVRNRDNDRVEGRVGGADRDRLAEFRRLLGQGPPAARVEAVSWIPSTGDGDDTTRFEILPGCD